MNTLAYNYSTIDNKVLVLKTQLFCFWIFILVLMILLLPCSFVFAINSEGCDSFVCNSRENYLVALVPFLPIICAIGLLVSILGIVRNRQQMTQSAMKIKQLWHLQTELKPLERLNKLFKITYVLSIIFCISLLALDFAAIRTSGMFGSTVGNVALGAMYGIPAFLGELFIYILPVPLFALWSVYFIKRLHFTAS